MRGARRGASLRSAHGIGYGRVSTWLYLTLSWLMKSEIVITDTLIVLITYLLSPLPSSKWTMDGRNAINSFESVAIAEVVKSLCPVLSPPFCGYTLCNVNMIKWLEFCHAWLVLWLCLNHKNNPEYLYSQHGVVIQWPKYGRNNNVTAPHV